MDHDDPGVVRLDCALIEVYGCFGEQNCQRAADDYT